MLCACFAAMLLIGDAALSQVITYPLRTSERDRKFPVILDSRMAASSMERGPGLGLGGNSNCLSVNYATTSETPDPDDYIQFYISPKPGYSFSPTSIEYAIWAEHSFSGWVGPRDWQLQYSLDEFCVTREILRKFAGARVIILTQHDAPELREEARSSGAFAFVCKDDLSRLGSILECAASQTRAVSQPTHP